MNPIRHILIVGGGTAGWLTAAFLARTLGTAAGGVRVTLVESSDIGIIGVGEGTFPSIRGTLAAIGLDEARFIRECDATFKQGVSFVDWSRVGERYFHPFNAPSQRPGAPELMPYWLLGEAGERAFADAVSMQQRVADASRAPKRASDGDWLGPMNYAYHFDAGKFATLLATHAQSLGVERVIATVERVERRGDGGIASVVTRERGTLSADLFVDCSGFRALLIGETLGAPRKPLNDVLFVDRALAVQVPWPAADTAIPSYTISTAHEAGWTWDIGLHRRRGVGYVYSSRHTSDEQAERVLRGYVGSASDALTPRFLKLETGYRETQWIGNCVAVGLSAGFLEPLESSGIGLIETAAYLIGYLFPADGNLEPAARQFNEHMRARFERIVDFLKLHYCLTRRDDNAFWRDNADPSSWTPTLRDRLAQWRSRPPHRLDFIADLEMYPPSSWQYVLYGMGYPTDLSHARPAWLRAAEARQEFAMIAQVAQRALADLPDHRALVDALCARASAPARDAKPALRSVA
ncbi:tryptophan halogenase family protein [Scleromatobacter humisilvae]|uniref:Tryptophan 7-halogenase n=1 Tax=Scleromatobacter humisilvae TaxID=2897159 RepID=A0A9X1YEX3_9BURK|nr:tryptophan halogenase family protein [Scleromatobacter humisilvae]MCK9685224.1 tryptophan 7-halogenase [Scleromatobacter humisilvae]